MKKKFLILIVLGISLPATVWLSQADEAAGPTLPPEWNTNPEERLASLEMHVQKLEVRIAGLENELKQTKRMAEIRGRVIEAEPSWGTARSFVVPGHLSKDVRNFSPPGSEIRMYNGFSYYLVPVKETSSELHYFPE